MSRRSNLERELAAAGPSAILSFAPEAGEHVRTRWTAPDGKQFTAEIFCGSTETVDEYRNNEPVKSSCQIFVPIITLVMSLPMTGPATITIGPLEGFRESDLRRRRT